MFDIGWGELLVIGVVALIAIGPKELPSVLRTVGQWMGKIRRMASEFQGQFQEAMREAEMADLKKQVDDITNTASSYTNFDPIGTVRNEIQSVLEDKKPDSAPSTPSTPTTSEPASASATSPAADHSPSVAPSSEPVTTETKSADTKPPEPKPGGGA